MKQVRENKQALLRERATQAQQRKRTCAEDPKKRSRGRPPPPHSQHPMTLGSNSVICQPHRQHGWLMDWEGMRDTSPGNPFIFICGRHNQAYLLRELLADNGTDTGDGAAARTDGERRQ